MISPLELGNVPFYWRIKKSVSQEPKDVPACLPFAFTFIPDLQLVIQKRDPLVLEWLEHVYKEDANVGYLQEGHALADSYGGEFIDFFSRASSLLSSSPSSAADIGCGGIYLLQKIRDKGLEVKGIDPSPVTAAAGFKSGIEIVPDFYPSPSLTERFDILFHYDVLEHVDDPVAFLKAHHDNLSDQGALVFAVPDCTHHIELGDVSMVLHEHLNYFDLQSLEIVVRAAGFEPLLLEQSLHGGVLMCCAVPTNSTKTSLECSKDNSKFTAFCNKAQTSLNRFIEFASKSTHSELGLYVPIRAFPYLQNISSDICIRFFDDDPSLRGCYYDGFNVKIENQEDLLASPPSQIMVCSLAFGDKIASRLIKKYDGQLSIVMWSDLFEEAK